MAKRGDPIFGVDDEIEIVDIPKPKIKKVKLPQGSEKVQLDNVVTVSEGALKNILKRTDKATRLIVGELLSNGVPTVLSYDNATSYVEAVLRDGLNIEVSIDDDILKIIDSLNKLSTAYTYSRMVNLPKSIRRKYLEELTTKFVEDAMLEMKKSSNTRKYSQNLRELVATVQTRSEQKNKKADTDQVSKVGVKKSKK